MIARRGASLGKQLQDVFGKVGSFYPLRENFRLTAEVKQQFTEKLRTHPSDFCGSQVAKVVRTDGLQLLLADGSWVCYLLSGTELVVRVYSEARSREGLTQLSEAAKAWIFD
jgi:phosphoglucomutase